MTANMKAGLAFAGGVLATLLMVAVLYWFSPGAPAPAAHAAPGAAAPPSRAPVVLVPAQASGIDLKTATVGKGAVIEEFSVPVTVVPDESRISHIHTRVAGWIEHLHVGNTGELVRAGQPIVDIFSQELFASQVEYLAARAMTGPPSAVAASGRARLKFLGMSENEIRAIEKSGKPNRVVTLTAPRSGVLAHRGIAAGTAVDPSTEIAIVLDLSRVWVLAEVPEFAAAGMKKGMAAQLAFGSDGAARVSARVEFIDPMLTEATRTLKVRFSLPNAAAELRPGMYGTALFTAPARTAVMVPRDALVDTGVTQYVYVVGGAGAYAPRAVRVGTRLKETVEIVDGLREGEKIVTSGVFLLDSESRLRASGGQGTSHAGHGTPAPAPDSEPARPHGTGEAGHD
ncbi:efflux RND transporter periplasmic adaptor subunit [Massilia scottii]|uniref:efflux RND transporter periplasmic adaptor subunit n=1 Tax=Massilia scottii TaxID=3057166 RepID=UPI0027965EA4|nr:efflux RND transporter periplasmic adaptor subunit [Massilia sp. CCM 9029]MDQ1831636.1 efflux RND transporter periplasmic adaptor subunit [Massilia sp. CCM 9029]